MCHHRESSPEWEALVEKELRTEEEEMDDEEAEPHELAEEESPDPEPAEPYVADD
ncbi:hypothetical protein GL213_02865 [Halogeometricum borinquense]|uniref:hypothetical protein n=1 Tax=Halogeometricum borinquense TaxID=60847 RepID=UPI001425D5D8|nr:hypothetical protein [Halogeometricum borinquense]QIQ75566.1 hypothetical protein GL213_02865 [Halogeometricum borinquense]